MRVVIGVGSNSPDKNRRIEDAMNFLASLLVGFEGSSVYSTPALNGLEDDYLNAVVSGDTELLLDELARRLKEFERECGRRGDDEYVAVDLDIVIADGTVLRPRDMAREYFQRGYRELMGSDQGPSERMLR